ncbi:PASTA domain-containing protein [Arthrobacter sp. E918]|uniref:PASTA domain-containing protein n=2 Tax=Arthrobacter mobilis TaxID=2724944 RepID=A0A7X6HAJ3_9MICC|nr:PASTA domain-containing protein [Arthrobacter mobilis]
MDAAPQGYPERNRGIAARAAFWTASVAAVALSAGSVVAPAAVAISVAGNSAVDYWEDLPGELPLDRSLPQHTVLLDKEGNEFARFYSENRIDVSLDQVSDIFLQTLITTEDFRFYEHHGVDPYGITRALVNNAISDDIQGASTITQQLVQNILVNNARDATEEAVAVGDTYNAKIREARYAVELEERLTKDEILNRYVNAVYFGNQAYGVEAAARIYFSTTAAKLNRAQSALLVGMLKAPGHYDPIRNPDAATQRRNTVISVLQDRAVISAEEARKLSKAPLGLKRGSVPSSCGDSKYPFYCAVVREEILTDPAFGATPEERQDRLSRGGMTLTTALDPKAAKAAQKAVLEALGTGNRAALGTAVVEPGTGHIAAIAQNRKWGSGKGRTEVVYAKQAFQVGSSMKPIVLATALSQGIPASTRLAANGPYHSVLDNPPGGYINYGNRDYGVIDAYAAIRSSVNVYFIRMIERTGVRNVAKFARTLGITSLPIDQLGGLEASLALGAYEVSPLEMAGAYAAFMSGGVVCRPVAVVAAERSDTGEKLPVPDPGCRQAIDPAVADTVADVLKEPFKPGGTLGLLGGPKGREAGAKTGTTNDFAANWIVGATPQLSAAVWLGDPRGGTAYPLNRVQAYGKTFHDLTGSEVAGPVWKATVEGALKGRPALPLPEAESSVASRIAQQAVPDVRGLKVDEALTVLLRNDLRPVIRTKTAAPNELYPADTVVRQSPAPGKKLRYRQKVELTLSDGSRTGITVPEER